MSEGDICPRRPAPALDILRVVAVAGVVAIHVFAATVENEAIRGSGTWWVAVAIDIGFIWVVPAFVMVSGALLFTTRMQGRDRPPSTARGCCGSVPPSSSGSCSTSSSCACG
nr:hypothetical protein GCM10025699_19620 [Microbacterium flavescens]